jgi:co-chaperonin GroES (HSP10)
MKIAPLGHRILVRHHSIEERDEAFKKAKAAGIMIAPTEDHKRREAGVDRGEVVALGPDAFRAYHLNSYGTLENFKPWCKPGDLIAFAKYSGMVIEQDDEKFLVINDEDVVANLEESNE